MREHVFIYLILRGLAGDARRAWFVGFLLLTWLLLLISCFLLLFVLLLCLCVGLLLLLILIERPHGAIKPRVSLSFLLPLLLKGLPIKLEIIHIRPYGLDYCMSSCP